MNMKRFLCPQFFLNLSRINLRSRCICTTSSPSSASQLPTPPFVHSYRRSQSTYAGAESALASQQEVAATNDFLSRFVWIMRKKVSDACPDCDRETVNGMLRVIVDQVVSEIDGDGERAPPPDFSEDLWRTVWEVSDAVVGDMKRAAKKEKMKRFLQCGEVKEMTRFAVEVGVRGDMLREMRYKWACEKMEEAEFHEGLERLRGGGSEAGSDGEEPAEGNEEPAVSLPEKRRGKIGYEIYGLDLSDPKWAAAADRVREAGETVWPEDAKPISGKCRAVNEKIMCLNEGDDPAPLLAEWAELLQPCRADWNALLSGLKEKNALVYFKVAELLLSEESFQTNICDYSNLINAHVKVNRFEDAERILQKMKEKGIAADLMTTTILVNMYCKAGNLDRAKEAYDTLKIHGFQPDFNIYNSMIMAYVNGGKHIEGFNLMREMDQRNIRPTDEIYSALLRSFAQSRDADQVNSVANSMQWAGADSSFEACKSLVEAYSKLGNFKQARMKFDHMRGLGLTPDDECTASMISAYQRQNKLDEALTLLSKLEKDGFQHGVATYSVIVDWLGQLQLVEEAEQLLGKISELGEAPPVKLHVSLCDMYSRAGNERKALQAFGVLEAKKDELGSVEFERIIKALAAGRFTMQAHRMIELMQARGFAAPEYLKRDLLASETLGRQRPLTR